MNRDTSMFDLIHANLIEHLAKAVPHVESQRKSDWLREAISVEAYNADALRKKPLSNEERMQEIVRRTKKSIARLTSLGGTDIGILYMSSLGEYSPFENEEGQSQNARTVVESKLCIVPPSRVNGDMRRGIALEDESREEFERTEVGSGLKPRPDLMEIFKSLYKCRLTDYPWLVGEPDAIYEDDAGKIHIVDFKVPANPDSIRNMEGYPPSNYNAQMGAYKAILELHGIQVESRILAPLNSKTMTTTAIIMPEPENFVRDLLALGDEAWGHVLNGTLPHIEYSYDDMEKHDDLKEDTALEVNRYIYFKQMENIAKKHANHARGTMEYLLKRDGIDPSGRAKTKIPGINYSVSKKNVRDKSAVEREFIRLGGDLNDPKLYVESESVTANIVRGKKDPHIGTVETLKRAADEVISDGIEELPSLIGDINHDKNKDHQVELTHDNDSEEFHP